MIVLLLNIQKPDLLTDKPTDSKLTGSDFIELGPRSAITHEPEFFSSETMTPSLNARSFT